MWRRRTAVGMVATLALLGAACSSGGDDDEAASTSEASASTAEETTTTTEPEVLEILATNDDGVPGEGLAVLVAAIEELENVEVTVVAPAGNQSGTGDATTEGELVVTETPLTDGREATAVAGKPADAVNYAIEEMGLTPHLVVSGVNPGQNIGPFSQLSGTVGAAKTGARQGIPAVAASSGTTDEFDFAQLAELVVEWIEENREALIAGTAEVQVVSFNAPACPQLRGLVEVPVATDFAGRNAFDTECGSTKPEGEIVDDVDASANGFASQSIIAY